VQPASRDLKVKEVSEVFQARLAKLVLPDTRAAKVSRATLAALGQGELKVRRAGKVRRDLRV